MKKPIFTGSAVAIVTPFSADGSVNYRMLKELIDFQIENKTDAIVVTGTTGESSTLSPAEHSEVIEKTVEFVAHRVPVIAGTGSNDTQFAIEHSKEAKASGVDALLLVTPYYNKTSQRGLVAHYTAIAEAVDLPLIAYNVPSRTGVNIAPSTYQKLSEIPNLVAAKEANGNISSVVETRHLCGDALHVYSGNDDQIVPLMSLGGLGVISVLANVMPRETHEICQLMLDGKTAGAAALQIKLSPLISALFSDVNPIPVKAALCHMGFDVGLPRLPLYPMEEAKEAKLVAAMQAAGLSVK